jgi:hypothetical protein
MPQVPVDIAIGLLQSSGTTDGSAGIGSGRHLQKASP